MEITEAEALRRYNKRHRVSWGRQFLSGGRTVLHDFALAPCPTCHGNDRIKEVAAAPGFAVVSCDRCRTEYLS